jgi:mRNA-degrading endonuclease toxin of MazEF toxin-antitoxin module
MATILRGNIYWADLNPVIGSEQGGLRPVLVLSHNVFVAIAQITLVDAHLITSAILTGVPIWTLDKKLAQAANALRIKY